MGKILYKSVKLPQESMLIWHIIYFTYIRKDTKIVSVVIIKRLQSVIFPIIINYVNL